MENPFKQETRMNSFLSEEVKKAAQNAARELLTDGGRESIEVLAANANFVISKTPQQITIWEFMINETKFYVNIESK